MMFQQSQSEKKLSLLKIKLPKANTIRASPSALKDHSMDQNGKIRVEISKSSSSLQNLEAVGMSKSHSIKNATDIVKSSSQPMCKEMGVLEQNSSVEGGRDPRKARSEKVFGLKSSYLNREIPKNTDHIVIKEKSSLRESQETIRIPEGGYPAEEPKNPEEMECEESKQFSSMLSKEEAIQKFLSTFRIPKRVNKNPSVTLPSNIIPLISNESAISSSTMNENNKNSSVIKSNRKLPVSHRLKSPLNCSKIPESGSSIVIGDQFSLDVCFKSPTITQKANSSIVKDDQLPLMSPSNPYQSTTFSETSSSVVKDDWLPSNSSSNPSIILESCSLMVKDASLSSKTLSNSSKIPDSSSPMVQEDQFSPNVCFESPSVIQKSDSSMVKDDRLPLKSPSNRSIFPETSSSMVKDDRIPSINPESCCLMVKDDSLSSKSLLTLSNIPESSSSMVNTDSHLPEIRSKLSSNQSVSPNNGTIPKASHFMRPEATSRSPKSDSIHLSSYAHPSRHEDTPRDHSRRCLSARSRIPVVRFHHRNRFEHDPSRYRDEKFTRIPEKSTRIEALHLPISPSLPSDEMRISRYRNSTQDARIICVNIVRAGRCVSERCISEHIFGGQAIYQSVTDLISTRKDFREAEELVIACTSVGSPFRQWLLSEVGRRTVVIYVLAALEEGGEELVGSCLLLLSDPYCPIVQADCYEKVIQQSILPEQTDLLLKLNRRLEPERVVMSIRCWDKIIESLVRVDQFTETLTAINAAFLNHHIYVPPPEVVDYLFGRSLAEPEELKSVCSMFCFIGTRVFRDLPAYRRFGILNRLARLEGEGFQWAGSFHRDYCELFKSFSQN